MRATAEGRMVGAVTERTKRLAQVTCEQSDLILGPLDYTREHWAVWSSRTDWTGEFGEPHVYMLWGPKGPTKVGLGLENILHPSGRGDTPDVKPCEHYVVFLDWRDDD